jgi:hypothetical protein
MRGMQLEVGGVGRGFAKTLADRDHVVASAKAASRVFGRASVRKLSDVAYISCIHCDVVTKLTF